MNLFSIFKRKRESYSGEIHHVCHTELQFKHSPAVRISALKEKWRRMSDSEVWSEVTAMSEDFARGGPNGEGYWFMHILKECKIKIGRTKVLRCYKCDEELTVVP
jgi:hypothetical protein